MKVKDLRLSQSGRALLEKTTYGHHVSIVNKN